MTTHLPLGPGAEFDAVRTLLAQWGPRAQGIGDDGAVLDVPAGAKLVVSTDTTVEHVHFRREWLTPEEIGWRATMAALSDLAAMAAAPLGVLLALTVPTAWREALAPIAQGLGEAAAQAGIPIVGGDVTDGDRLALAITVLGYATHPLARSGARPGDTIYVTGRLGGPGAALAAWLAGREPTPAHRARFAHPEARLASARWCARQGATAAIDLSDGLAGDLAHLAAASGVCCELALERLPVLDGVTPREALVSGEEYELLLTAPALDAPAFAAAHAGLQLTAIGQVVAGPAGAVHLLEGGQRLERPATHDHFAS
jgi:thiamine-monophosphate kinase